MEDAKPLFSPWPTDSQALLLDVALSDRPVPAFERWLESVDLEEEIGWNSVRLLPLAYRNLSRHGCTDPRMSLLKGVYRRVWMETNQIFHRAAPVLQALYDEGIDLLLLKGAPIAVAYYRNPSLRAMSDIDVCIRRNKLEAADRVLAAHGWTPNVPIRTMSRYRHGLEYRHGELGSIDLHWHVVKEVPDPAVDERFWAASEPLDFMGIRVRQLHPRDALLHTLLHGLSANHDPPIRWITDSLAILNARGGDVDWAGLIAFGERHRLLYRIAIGVLYLVENHDAHVPEEYVNVLRAARPSLVDRLEKRWVHRAHSRSPLAWPWKLAFIRHCRIARTRNPLAFVHGYLRFVYRTESAGELGLALARTVSRLPRKAYRHLRPC